MKTKRINDNKNLDREKMTKNEEKVKKNIVQGGDKKDVAGGEVRREVNNNVKITCSGNAGSSSSSEYYDEAVGGGGVEVTIDDTTKRGLWKSYRLKKRMKENAIVRRPVS